MGRQGTVQCWVDKMCVKTLSNHFKRMTAFVVSEFMFSGQRDGTINCWTLDGDIVKKLESILCGLRP